MKLELKHFYKKTPNGNFHIPFFSISFGKEGFMLAILGLAIVINTLNK